MVRLCLRGLKSYWSDAMLPLLLLAGAVCALAQTVTLSPDGPVKTLAEARDAARAIHAKTPGASVRIEIRGGTYYLTETLVLGPEDSNTAWEAAPGARVLVSGGRAIGGWTKGPGNVWTAPAGEPYFRQLFISGRRAQRARTPNFGFLRIDGPSPVDKPFQLKYRGADIKPEWAGTDAEVVALLAWADIRMPIVSVDAESHIATLAGAPRKSNREIDARYYIENAPDALDTAGEWYLDRKTGVVSYRPVTGEDPTKEQVIAPALTLLVKLEGRPEQGQLVRRVVFRGIHFAHSDWSMGPQGYADMQASVLTAQTAFEAVGAEECVVERCVFRQIGGYAVWFGRGCKRNRIAGNEIADAGGGGVKIGETVQQKDERDRNWEHVVGDNHIHDVGLVFPPAVGVWVGQSSRNVIAHNHIHDLYYTAISVGWTWGYGPNQCNANIVEYNHLHSIGKDMLSDMGGIYTLGMQPGTILRNNLIHDISSFTYGGWGIYPDEGSTQMVIENNVVYRCKSAGFHQHYGRENIVRNNIFALNRENQLMRTRAEPHLSFTFTGNIVYFDQGRLLGSNWTGEQFKMDRNLYFDARSTEVRFAGKSLEEWRAAGQDRASIVADPLFVNPAKFDFRLRPGSPAAKIGFKPIDLSTVGPRR
ncbi:MAG: right-handed parallel beta-helix repeat-containing protein [Acidobacteria bacterium]|nr:right-handed parallel beta-helix repeat-containing protein [Acidobacteriota bacterium]